jgi:CDP-diglyceride synthetase
MKTRILTAAVCIPVLLLILLVLDKIVATVLVGALLAVSAYELLYATGLVKEPRLVIYSCIGAFFLAISLFSVCS